MGEEWLRRGRSERGEGEGDIIIKDEVGKKTQKRQDESNADN